VITDIGLRMTDSLGFDLCENQAIVGGIWQYNLFKSEPTHAAVINNLRSWRLSRPIFVQE